MPQLQLIQLWATPRKGRLTPRTGGPSEEGPPLGWLSTSPPEGSTMHASYNLTSNEFYGGLNKRFDRRIRRIVRSTKLRYDKDKHAYASDVRPSRFLSFTTIMYSEKRVWQDELARVLRTGERADLWGKGLNWTG